MNKEIFFFTQALIQWNKNVNSRAMPWKGIKDPYRIWLSEIILQQTKVDQGLAYYERFLEAFPRIGDLASAPEQKVFKLWEGLGYYTRCKNLIVTARYIQEERKGHFPDTYQEILMLKGIGPYTAAAISSFAFDLPYAVVDGNVFRVLSRFFGIDTPIDSTAGKKIFTELAAKCLDESVPGLYNQALMDFGAVICKPQLPFCETCPLQPRCQAYKQHKAGKLPVKSKKLVRRDRSFIYLVVHYNGKVYVRKRPDGDIWENLFEFILYETAQPKELEDYYLMEQSDWFRQVIGKRKYSIDGLSEIYKQLLTHQTIRARFVNITISKPLALAQGYELVTSEDLLRLPFSRLINGYMKTKNRSGYLF